MDTNTVQEPQYQTMYNLTFDEVESQLGNTGKSHHNMNLDELLKNVISAESGQLVQNPSPHNNHNSFLLGNTSSSSSSNFNGTLLSSNKTISEVWMEINNRKHVTGSVDTTNLQQSILGETTLQDFIARAGGAVHIGNNNNNNQDHVGVNIGDAAQRYSNPYHIPESTANLVTVPQPLMAMDSMVMASQPENWFPLQMQMQMPMPMVCPDFHQHQHEEQKIIGLCPDFKSVYENKFMEIGYSENSMAMSMMSTSDSKEGVAVAGGVGRKQRYSDEMLEKSIERKQKRMAKNRESAARSRAKKQEHLNKLQRDKICLEKTNRWLKKRKYTKGATQERIQTLDEQVTIKESLNVMRVLLRRSFLNRFEDGCVYP